MLEKIKLALRIKTTAFDTEINDLIAAAKADLIFSGLLVAKVIDTDTLIIRAVTLYVKSNFGLDNNDSEKYQQAYESLRAHLALSRDYTGFKVTFTVKVLTVPVGGAIIKISDNVLKTNSVGIAIYYHYTDGTDIEYAVSFENYYANGIVLIDSDKAIAVNLA